MGSLIPIQCWTSWTKLSIEPLAQDLLKYHWLMKRKHSCRLPQLWQPLIQFRYIRAFANLPPQIIGWMVRSFFESSIINWSESQEEQKPFGCLLSESQCRAKASRDNEEEDAEGYISCYSWHAWSWLRLVELAGTEEGASVDTRYAAGKSLLTSKALFWSTRSSVDGIRQQFDEKYSKFSGGGSFSCRLWQLALKMLQVRFVPFRGY